MRDDHGTKAERDPRKEDDWSRMSVESISSDIVSDFDFLSSDEEEEIASPNGDISNSKGRLARPFDLFLVIASIERSEDVLKKVKGRDVVLVVGKTVSCKII